MNTTLPFTLESSVGEIVAAQPRLAAVLERVGIDYCCGGRATLASACAARGLDGRTLLAALAAMPVGVTEAPADAAAMSLAELADHIESTHHTFLKEELPILAEQARRVGAKHGGRDPRLAEIAELTNRLTEELLHHLQEEELLVFPLVRELEHAQVSGGLPLSAPLGQLEEDHAEAGQMLARLRELTDGFTPPPEACNTHRALFAGLAHLEQDLHQHVHKENNVLFPRALALEARVPGRN